MWPTSLASSALQAVWSKYISCRRRCRCGCCTGTAKTGFFSTRLALICLVLLILLAVSSCIWCGVRLYRRRKRFEHRKRKREAARKKHTKHRKHSSTDSSGSTAADSSGLESDNQHRSEDNISTGSGSSHGSSKRGSKRHKGDGKFKSSSKGSSLTTNRQLAATKQSPQRPDRQGNLKGRVIDNSAAGGAATADRSLWSRAFRHSHQQVSGRKNLPSYWVRCMLELITELITCQQHCCRAALHLSIHFSLQANHRYTGQRALTCSLPWMKPKVSNFDLPNSFRTALCIRSLALVPRFCRMLKTLNSQQAR